ncbi:MAG TPA: hypothetical protein VFW33_20430, partial [Gemmataceae bacterium]|nr:hypothetical protein [Gemmataceae bacterium]
LGLFVAVVFSSGLHAAGQIVYPLPSDREALKQAIPNMPAGAFLLWLGAYAVGALAGGFVAAWVARRRPALHALIVGGLLTVLGVLNLVMLPGHPAWFCAANLVVYLLPAYLGSRLAPCRAAAGR